jgi:hypothetical protein
MSVRKLFHPTQFVLPGLVLLTIFVYLPPYHAAFVGDDYVQLDYISEFLSRPFTAYRVFDPFWLPWYYRPTQNLWFLANRLIFGLNPFGYYYSQICFHALAVALVYRVARQLGLRPWAALASAALFALHGHFLDVVTWISSIAIVMAAIFSLLSLSAFLSYLERPQRPWLLAATVAFFLLTLLSHEEAILLPPFLLLLRVRLRERQSLLRNAHHSLMKDRRETAAFLFMFALVAGYLVLQFTRPNLTIDLSATPPTHWRQYLAPLNVSHFAVETLLRFTLLFNLESILLANSYLVTFFLLLFIAFWAWQGGRVVRLGLIWAGLHLAFIYWALWSQKPEFYAGRHIYNAWIGLVLAIGATIDQVVGQTQTGARRKLRLEVTNLRSLASTLISNYQLPIIMTFILAGILLANINITWQTQRSWLAKAQEDKRVEEQMKRLLPEVTADSHLFANRFVVTPSFLRAVAQVWYDQPLSPPAGSFSQLKLHGRATDDFYLFDYANGQLVNLMPELQEHDETIFLWSQEPRAEIVPEDGEEAVGAAAGVSEMIITGPEGDQRLAFLTEPPESGQGWLSLVYVVSVPDQSELRLAMRKEFGRLPGEDGMAFRVRLMDQSGQTETLLETFLTAGEAGTEEVWQEVAIPLQPYWNQAVVLRLEVSAGKNALHDQGYWANPRFVIDHKE